jgi:hypothetical protein
LIPNGLRATFDGVPGKGGAVTVRRRRKWLIFFESRVWSQQVLPAGFDLSNVVSFEGSKVRFFDFGKMCGDYYRRTGQN